MNDLNLTFANPADSTPVRLNASAVRALRYARDALKAAGASDRCVDKVRKALSSAEGAQRHAENMSYRKRDL